MSCYLTIYKNEEFIATYCRGTYAYGAFAAYAEFDKTVEFNAEERFKKGIENLKEVLDETNKLINKYKLALTSQLTAEDALGIADDITDVEKDIESINCALCELSFMLTMAEDSQNMRENRDTKDIWTWSLG